MSDSATSWTVADRFLCPWNSPGKNTGVSCYFLLQGIFLSQESSPCLLCLLYWLVDSLSLSTAAAAAAKSLQSCPTLCNPIDSSPPAPPSLGFSRQEHWSGLPFPSPMHESEKIIEHTSH